MLKVLPQGISVSRGIGEQRYSSPSPFPILGAAHNIAFSAVGSDFLIHSQGPFPSVERVFSPPPSFCWAPCQYALSAPGCVHFFPLSGPMIPVFPGRSTPPFHSWLFLVALSPMLSHFTTGRRFPVYVPNDWVS